MDAIQYKFYVNKIKSLNYDKQDHWDIFDELFFDKISYFDSMSSFRTNGISNMLETGLPSQEREDALRGKHYSIDYNIHEIEDIKKRFDELQLMLGDDISKIPFNSTVGTPRRYNHVSGGKNYSLNFDDLYHVYSAWQIKRSIEFLFEHKKVKTILEIGAGYGNLAHKLKFLYPNVKYIIVDLPEVLLIQHYFINKNNPQCKIKNLLDYQDIPYSNANEIDCDVLLVPFKAHKKIKINFDVAINTRSFGEMPKEVLHDYIAWVEKNINHKGLLYTTNRYVFTKSIDKNKIRDYPFDDHWDPVISQPQWLQTHLHEFMLQRVPGKPTSPLSFKLRSFPVSTPPPGPIMQNIQTQEEWLRHQKKNK